MALEYCSYRMRATWGTFWATPKKHMTKDRAFLSIKLCHVAIRNWVITLVSNVGIEEPETSSRCQTEQDSGVVGCVTWLWLAEHVGWWLQEGKAIPIGGWSVEGGPWLERKPEVMVDGVGSKGGHRVGNSVSLGVEDNRNLECRGVSIERLLRGATVTWLCLEAMKCLQCGIHHWMLSSHFTFSENTCFNRVYGLGIRALSTGCPCGFMLPPTPPWICCNDTNYNENRRVTATTYRIKSSPTYFNGTQIKL